MAGLVACNGREAELTEIRLASVSISSWHSALGGNAADCSRTRDEQRLHVCAARHQRIRRLEVLAQFSLPDERARNNKGFLQASSLPERNVEKGIAEIGPLGLVLAAERWMVGIGRGDDQDIGVSETRDKDAGIAGRD